MYIASFLLDEGESTGELAGKFPGNELGPALRPVPVGGPDGQTVNDLYIQQERFREVFAADVPPDVADLMAVTQRPIVADALEEKAARAAWKTIPSWTMVTLQDLAVPAQSQRFMAERARSHTVEVDASHAVTVSQPGAVAELIDAAAQRDGRLTGRRPFAGPPVARGERAGRTRHRYFQQSSERGQISPPGEVLAQQPVGVSVAGRCHGLRIAEVHVQAEHIGELLMFGHFAPAIPGQRPPMRGSWDRSRTIARPTASALMPSGGGTTRTNQVLRSTRAATADGCLPITRPRFAQLR